MLALFDLVRVAGWVVGAAHVGSFHAASAVIESVRRLRQTLIAHMLQQQPPPADAAREFSELVPKIAQTDLDAHQLALLWGELQLLLVEGEGRAEDAACLGACTPCGGGRLGEPAAAARMGKPAELFHRDLFPRLAGAVSAPRAARMQACIEVTTRLRTWAARPIGREYSGLLTPIADMQYPRFGTSGWRARMGQDFTWRRAQAVIQAIVEFVCRAVGAMCHWPSAMTAASMPTESLLWWRA